jgi:hypothetical protein
MLGLITVKAVEEESIGSRNALDARHALSFIPRSPNRAYFNTPTVESERTSLFPESFVENDCRQEMDRDSGLYAHSTGRSLTAGDEFKLFDFE